MTTYLDHHGWTAAQQPALCPLPSARHPAISTGQAVSLDLRPGLGSASTRTTNTEGRQHDRRNCSKPRAQRKQVTTRPGARTPSSNS
jgi:hypothetical protein